MVLWPILALKFMKIYIKTIKSGIVAIFSYIVDENQYKTIKKVVLWPLKMYKIALFRSFYDKIN